ncbi:hypothetical protein J3A83DRAFT_4184583 [Scleroderma citrinum]
MPSRVLMIKCEPFGSSTTNCKRWFPKSLEKDGVGQKAVEKAGRREDCDCWIPPVCKDRLLLTLVDIAVNSHIAYGATSDGNLELKLSDNVVAEVAQLSEEEAKRTLTVITRTMNIRPSHLCSKEKMPRVNVTLSQAFQPAHCDLNLEEVS